VIHAAGSNLISLMEFGLGRQSAAGSSMADSHPWLIPWEA
jgi:hypothetical protein